MYQINDGVKRAKAAQLAGHTEILAKVFEDYEESKVLCERRVRLDALLSPRTSFPVHNRPDFPNFGGLSSGRQTISQLILTGGPPTAPREVEGRPHDRVPNQRLNSLVRAEGFEPPRLSSPDPKSGVSTSSTTPALESMSAARSGQPAASLYQKAFLAILRDARIKSARCTVARNSPPSFSPRGRRLRRRRAPPRHRCDRCGRDRADRPTDRNDPLQAGKRDAARPSQATTASRDGRR